MKTSNRNIAVVIFYRVKIIANWLLTFDWIRIIHNCGVGIGTLLIGIGGLAAFYQTSEILKKITELDKKIIVAQEQINYIDSVVQELKRKQIKSTANSLIKSIPLLQEESPLSSSIKEALIKSPEITIQSDTTHYLIEGKKYEPYLKSDQLEELSKRISSTSDLDERRKLLEGAIKIDMPSYIKEDKEKR
jgi:hypothetical protein